MHLTCVVYTKISYFKFSYFKLIFSLSQNQSHLFPTPLTSKKINLNNITPDNISKNTATTPQYGHFTKIKSCIVTKLIMCYNWVNKNYFPSFSLHIINCFMCFNIKCWLILSSCYTSFELFFLFVTESKIKGFNCTLTTFRSNSFALFSASFWRLSRFLFLFTSFNLLCFRLSFASSCYDGS